MTIMNENEIKALVSSVVRAVNSGDIKKLTKKAYKYLYLCSGFIAHYDYYGFCGYYQNTENLKSDLIRYKSQNQWLNFRPGDQNYDYYSQKAVIYNKILAGLSDLFALV